MALQAGRIQALESEEHSARNNLVLVVNADREEVQPGAEEVERRVELLEIPGISKTAKKVSSEVIAEALAEVEAELPTEVKAEVPTEVKAEVKAEVPTEATPEDNSVLRTVQEFSHLHREMHDVRENLVALGAPFQTVGVLVELGFNSRHDEQEKLIKTCLETNKVNGVIEPATEEKFRQQLLQLTELERDMAHARKLARESGMLLPALNALTNMIRQNPGDGGELVINTFVAYAIASGVKLEKAQEILDSSKKKKESVLPVIELDIPDPQKTARKALIRDLVLSTCITVFIMWLVV